MATSLTPDRTDSPVPTGKQVSPGLSHSFRPSTAISASDQHPQSTQLASDVVPPTRPFETVFTVEGDRSNSINNKIARNVLNYLKTMSGIVSSHLTSDDE